MKKSSKLLTLLVVLSLVFSFACLSLSAVDVEQGRTYNSNISFDDVAGVDGKISYSNPDLFTAVTAKPYTNSKGEVDKDAFLLNSADAEKTKLGFALTFKLSAKAKVNETCVVTITYNTWDENGNAIEKNKVQAITIKAVEAKNNVDYSKLDEQIALAEVLVEKDYTAESWAVLATALANGKSARTSNSQSVVDIAADALEAARLALVKLDYSALIAALAEVDAYYTTDDVTALLENFVEAVMNGNYLLENGGSQADINEAAKTIRETLAALKAALENVGETKIEYVEVVKEVEVEKIVEVPVDKIVEVEVQNNLWLVLFIILAVIFVAGVVVQVVIYVKKTGGLGG